MQSLRPILDPADEALLTLLPGELAEIGRLIGVASCIKLVETWGGRRLYIPAHVTNGHPLAELLGLDVAMALCTAYAGERPEIPRAQGWRQTIKAHAIALARASGLSQAEVARQYGMTERGVRKVERRAERTGSDVQLPLF
jgi:Mor family transcriptional regulator